MARCQTSNVEWRPVELRSGTFSDLNLKIHRVDGKDPTELPEPRTIDRNPNHMLRALISDTILDNGQALVFVNSRASAQKEARELSKHLIRKQERGTPKWPRAQITLWGEVSSKLENVNESTSMGRAAL